MCLCSSWSLACAWHWGWEQARCGASENSSVESEARVKEKRADWFMGIAVFWSHDKEEGASRGCVEMARLTISS